MKNLKVTVNGVTYDVQVEEQTAGTPASAAASAAPKTTVQTPAATVPAPA
ncbi:MAG TPA: acetyl-CoA carboxylase biotin carboxyl carrier protein subunit, partial [Ruminococcaceae bacterium]|nr:acetyl-CoA carboxylase biotin carboxyl carrier protein subunit [Oscillospiraceae bacterium]